MRRQKILFTLITAFLLLLWCNLYFLHKLHDSDAALLLEASSPSQKTQIYLFDSSTLSLRGVNMRELNHHWKSKSTYGDLLSLSPGTDALNPRRAIQQQQNATTNNRNRVIILWHAVPKTAGTTVRKAIFKHIAETCPSSGEAATQQGAFRDVSSLHQLMTECVETHDYGLGGRMTFRQLEESNNVVVIHTLAFRSYEEWAQSALNQIVKVFGMEQCNTVREHLSDCEDYRELSFYQYTKTQLKRIRRQSLSEKDIVILYNYKDTDLFHSTIRNQLELPSLKLESYNTNRTTEKCPDNVLEMFYKCHELWEWASVWYWSILDWQWCQLACSSDCSQVSWMQYLAIMIIKSLSVL